MMWWFFPWGWWQMILGMLIMVVFWGGLIALSSLGYNQIGALRAAALYNNTSRNC